VAMGADAIRDCLESQGHVLDAFVGFRATTLIADEKKKKNRAAVEAYGVEIDPAYCDVAIRPITALYAV